MSYGAGPLARDTLDVACVRVGGKMAMAWHTLTHLASVFDILMIIALLISGGLEFEKRMNYYWIRT